MFRFTQEPSSGSTCQCLAIITDMVQGACPYERGHYCGGIHGPVVRACSVCVCVCVCVCVVHIIWIVKWLKVITDSYVQFGRLSLKWGPFHCCRHTRGGWTTCTSTTPSPCPSIRAPAWCSHHDRSGHLTTWPGSLPELWQEYSVTRTLWTGKS